MGLSSDAGGAPKVNRNAPNFTKKRPSRIPPPQTERILQRSIVGQSIRKISREEGRARQTVTKIVRSKKMQAYVEAMRERFYGLGDLAVAAVQHALQEKKDPNLAYRLLIDIGVVPTAEQRYSIATQPAEALPKGCTPAGIMLAQAIADKMRIFNMSPPAVLANVDAEK